MISWLLAFLCSSQVPYELLALVTYSNGYWEVYRRFQGDFFCLGVGLRGGAYVERSFLGGICHGGREIQ